MLIEDRLKNEDFSYNEELIIQYILDQKSAIRTMTMRDIANATFTSPATMSRIAHKLNYSGWETLKADYLKELEYLESQVSEIDANQPFNKEDSLLTIATKISVLKKESIDDTLSLIKQDDLRKSVNILEKADLIHIFGVRQNALIAQSFKHNLMQIQKHAEIHSIQGQMMFDAYQARSSSCAIILSYSGETRTLVQCAKYLKEHQVPIISITSIGNSTISSLSSCNLRICTREKQFSKIASFSTDVSIIYLLEVLYSCLFTQNYDKNWKSKVSPSFDIEQDKTTRITLGIIKEKD
ncbi:MurR/RpiR family transcriptional regulator [Holdemania massiliensis]|uniref:MurR/RpiR family transcriptional regulator n=1 Tax=Holdemania massiliensis TaxID=1468449 RepID=UPI001F0574D4|nr:MurR/RpiR family transcriptional regulator [Holdemania massiliensis]MCH1939728.1 MurR/RpiR family transcriptional regulator [Holdemania massiliensis]